MNRPVVPEWAITFVRRSAGRGADPLAVEALARRVAGLVGVFEKVLASWKPGTMGAPLATALKTAIDEAKKL